MLIRKAIPAFLMSLNRAGVHESNGQLVIFANL